MNLLDELKKNNTVLNTKGSKYYATSFNANLDLFSMVSRFNRESDIITKFNKAFLENEDLALANLLYILDIRNGKGERRVFKILYKFLCETNSDAALKILPFIGSLGRYDYILEGINTSVEKETVALIKEQLTKDMDSDNPSLLAKWMPSLRTHKKNNLLAKRLVKLLDMSEKEYRSTLSVLRKKINIVEKNLTNKQYENIDFNKVPAKAMLKYSNAFNKWMPDKFREYKTSVTKGEGKVNTNGLFCYEIINKILNNNGDKELFDLMWKNQKKITTDKNVLVVADTSGSMTLYGGIPICASIGLAIYTAERNSGIFKNHYITFSEEPTIQEIKGKTIYDIVQNMECINPQNTDIDKVFELLLNVLVQNEVKESDVPSHILIISDMEFDDGVQSKGGTNFSGWKKAFADKGYKLPTVIFWNVAGMTLGIPVTKYDSDVAIVSGFSVNVLENLFTLDKYNPTDVMLEQLKDYLEML